MTARPRPINPDLADLLEAWGDHLRLDLRTALPGRVESYDAAAQTANVLPLLRHPVPQPDGSVVWEDPPVIPSVPVVFPRIGAWFLAFALRPGDTVLLLCLEASAGAWRAGGGEMQDAEDLRRHHLANAVAIPGLFPRADALANAPAATGSNNSYAASDTPLVLGSDDGTRLGFLQSGAVQVTQPSGVALEVTPAGHVKIAGATEVATDGVLNGSAIDPFTGSTHAVLGNASTRVFARKL